MLFFETDPQSTGEAEGKKIELKGRTLLGQLEEMGKLIGEYVAPQFDKVYANLNKALIDMDDKTQAINRSMGGFADQSGELRENIMEAVEGSRGLSVEFKDGIDLVKGMASEMGRMVNPSQEVLENAMAFSKATGLGFEDTGKMIVQFQEFGGNQKEAITRMSELGDSARKSGLDAKSFTQEVAKNLKQASLFGFKNGVKDIEAMVKKTKLLGTSLEKLQIKGAAENLLDPEKAMETAASLQMIGGNIGALGDPFQLLHMGQNDMKKLTDEVLNMSKATFTFDKETGTFKQTTADMYALKAQAQALGINYEEAANAGKELAKVDFIKSKTNLADKIADEDTQNLVAGLSQISKDGTVSIDIPGFKETFNTLDENLQDPEFINALEEYQKKAALSDKDLALTQMSLQEKQTAATLEIQQLLLFTMDPKKRDEFLLDQKKANENLNKTLLEKAEPTAKQVGDYATNIAEAEKIGVDVGVKVIEGLLKTEVVEAGLKAAEETAKLGNAGLENVLNGIKDFMNGDTELITEQQQQGPVITNQQQGPVIGGNTQGPVIGGKKQGEDMFFPSGDKPTLLSRGKIYEGIAEDSVYVGTDFEKIFSRAKNATNILSDVISQKNNTGGNTEVSGKIDFGTLTVKIDAPSGVDKTALDQTLNSRQFTTHIMNMVANQKSFYSNQTTLEG